MYILAFDTCCGTCSVAILDDNEILFSDKEQQHNRQSERLLPMIEESLAAAGLQYTDLDYIAVTIGPGSFTGIRIGLAAAQGIALIIRKPIIGITTLEAMALESGEPKVMVALNAGRNQVYVQKFHDLMPITEPALLDCAKIQEVAVGNSVVGNFAPTDNNIIIMPDARYVGLAAIRKVQTPGFTPSNPEPLYIRQPDAVPPSKRNTKT